MYRTDFSSLKGFETEFSHADLLIDMIFTKLRILFCPLKVCLFYAGLRLL